MTDAVTRSRRRIRSLRAKWAKDAKDPSKTAEQRRVAGEMLRQTRRDVL